MNNKNISNSKRERLNKELDEALDTYLINVPPKFITYAKKLVREDVLNFLEDDIEQRESTHIVGKSAVKYFWEALLQYLKYPN